MIEKLMRFVLGYVKVEINGIAIERFINLVLSRNIHIWNVVSKDNKVCFCIKPKDTYKLKPVIEKIRKKPAMNDDKYIFDFRIKERYGLPFFLYAYRKRKMFYIGVFIGWLIVYSLSRYIWNISFEGNMKHTDEELYRFLRRENITEGIKKDNVKGERIEKMLRNEYFDITWASVEITGTKLIVYVRENTNNTEEKIDNDKEIGALKATKSAEIVSIVTRSGTPVVGVGDTVNKGDVLISDKVLLYKDDMSILTEKMDVMHNMARVLFERETIHTAEVEMLMAGKSAEEVIAAMDSTTENN